MNIVDMLHIILRRKWISLSGLMLPILIMIIILSIMDSVYEGEVLLKIGKVNNDGWVEDPQALSLRINTVYPNIAKIKNNKGGIIKIVINGKSLPQVLTSIDNIVNHIIKEHDIKLNNIKSEIQDNKKLIEEKIAKHTYFINEKKKILNVINKKLETVFGSESNRLGSNNPANKEHFIFPSGKNQNMIVMSFEAWLLSTKTDILKDLSMDEMVLIDLSAEDAKKQKELSNIELARTCLLSKPTEPIKVKPRINTYLALGFIIGVFLSIYLPVTVDFLIHQIRN